MMMVIIPILIFPIIMNVFVRISASFSEEAAVKPIKIGYVGLQNDLLEKLEMLSDDFGKKELIAYTDTTKIKDEIKKDSLDLGIFFPVETDKNLREMKPVNIHLYYDATDMGMKERAEHYIEEVEKIKQQERYIELNLEEAKLTPIKTNYSNIASDKEMVGKLAGGILPYIFIAFGFIGCMYPAIDLFTGEKERATIETLLTTPVQRWQILTGKMGVVVLSGLMASSFALLGLFLSIEVMDIVENEELLGIVHSILTPKFIFMLYFLLIPLTVFFAGVMIPVAVYAKSFKEAQSIITPLNIVMVLPAMVGFFPGVELNNVTAMIPVVNVVLSTKELIAGTLEFGSLFLSFSIMLGLASIAVFLSYKRFDKETNVVV